jgi:hypothetical protein
VDRARHTCRLAPHHPGRLGCRHPHRLAVGFSLQPDLVGLFPFQITAGATTLSLGIEGDAGARHLGVWSDVASEPLTFLRLWETTGTADGFALGEFSLFIAAVPEPGAWAATAALLLSGWAAWRRVNRHG